MPNHDEPDTKSLRSGHILFAQECTFLRPVAEFSEMPALKLPEIAFAGRSNVGKSSLINALTNRKTLARVSNTPGRTREIILFDLGERLTIADLPGYGFARISKVTSESWHRLIDSYLKRRTQLQRVCLLIDSRHPAHDSDLLMMKLLDAAAMSYVVVLTKLDKLNAAERDRAINDATMLMKSHPAAHPELFVTSAETGDGIPALRAHLARVALPPEKRYKTNSGGKRA
jgi:GTP-binding protein